MRHTGLSVILFTKKIFDKKPNMIEVNKYIFNVNSTIPMLKLRTEYKLMELMEVPVV